jgi:hypothetical protein
VHQEIIQAKCVLCHSTSGMAGTTELVFQKGTSSQLETTNLASLAVYVTNESATRVLNKAKGQDNHGGGVQLASTSAQYSLLVSYLSELTGQALGGTSGLSKSQLTLESPSSTYRRASLLLTGKIPSRATLESLTYASKTQLRTALLALMETQEFRAFIKRGANDQLLTRSLIKTRSLIDDFDNYYPVFNQRYRIQDATTGVAKVDSSFANEVMNELAEAPLELIAHVIMTNRPYSEIITADYTMVSQHTAAVYKTGLSPAAGTFTPAKNLGQHLATEKTDQPKRNWDASRPLQLPHAGLLSEPGFLQQYPTTATNRNRARARWTYQHFLGIDIENSTARTLDAADLTDSNNPTLNNAACTQCHANLDPVAGAYQNFGERGIFRERNGGLNSLDASYRRSKLFKLGDLWYADMRAPGFEGQPIAERDQSLAALAQHLVNDPRFSEGVVKFWWPALFGEPLLGDDLSAAQRDAKLAALEDFANKFAASQFNFKSLLADILMSDWFRGAQLTESTAKADAYTGGKRLLTPEELSNKTLALTGLLDKNITEGLNLTFGGIDSLNADKRQRNLSHMMLRVAQRHALANSCTIVATEFNKPQSERLLFTLVERDSLPSSAYKKTQVFSTTSPQTLEWPIAIDALPGQTLAFTATQTQNVQSDATLDTVTLNRLEIVKPDGSLLVGGEVGALFDQLEWITGNPLAGKSTPFRIRKYNALKINVPIDQSGTWIIRLNATATTANNALEIALAPGILSASAQHPANQVIRRQVAQLLERLQGRWYAEDSPEVRQYTQLFIDLRQAKIDRKAGDKLTETGVRCDYNGNGLTWSVWAADPAYSLSAWRGLIVALMADYHYIYE